jgi:transcriptional regulator with XRE-family HTH domain
MAGAPRSETDNATAASPLGERLRACRRARRLTLKDVADGAGLSVGFISQIERGIASPSLSSLAAVAQVLEVDVGEFLSRPASGTPLTRHDQRPIFAVSENSVTYERLSTSFPGNVLRSVIIHEPPGHRGEPIAHEGEEIIYVLKGALTVEIEGERSVLEANDSVHFQSSRVHSTWNHTDRPATVLWVGTMDVFGEGGKRPAAEGGTRNRRKKGRGMRNDPAKEDA